VVPYCVVQLSRPFTQAPGPGVEACIPEDQASTNTACFQQVRAGAVMAVPRYCRQGRGRGYPCGPADRRWPAALGALVFRAVLVAGIACLGVGGQADRSAVCRRMARHPGCLPPGGSASPSPPATIALAVGARENPSCSQSCYFILALCPRAWAAARRKGPGPARRPWSWRVQEASTARWRVARPQCGHPGGDRARGVQRVGLGAGQDLGPVAPALVGRDLPGGRSQPSGCAFGHKRNWISAHAGHLQADVQKRNYPGLCLPPGPTSQPRQCPSAARYCGRSLTVASVNNEDGPYFAELLRVLDESGRIRYALYRFKTNRRVSDLGIHEIGYAAW